MRSPLLYDTLRRFCLGAFALFHQDLDGGADLPFAFEEHGSYGRPTLYEYRPLVRGFVEARTDRLFERRDVRDAVLDQRLVAGIGNLWKAEALWEARVSPWRALEDVPDPELLAVLDAAHRLMRSGVEGTRPLRRVYRRVGRPCRRCGATIRSRAQGAAARTAYWCPGCQRADDEPA